MNAKEEEIPMDKVLEIKNLTKKYGAKTALDNITFSVSRSSCFGLLGPNGAGKSTAIKILAGITGFDSGQVSIFTLDAVGSKSKICRRVGYVPQEITIYNNLSAYNNLVFFGELYGLRGKELKGRVEEVLEDVGLKDKANDLAATFSGGMKRRLNIAAALMHKPDLLILDEPTVGVDPQSRNHIFGILRALKAQGVTTVYSTHYMEEVEALCDDIAIIDNGKVIAQGRLSELYEKYGDGTTARPSLETIFLSLTGTSLRD